MMAGLSSAHSSNESEQIVQIKVILTDAEKGIWIRGRNKKKYKKIKNKKRRQMHFFAWVFEKKKMGFCVPRFSYNNPHDTNCIFVRFLFTCDWLLFYSSNCFLFPLSLSFPFFSSEKLLKTIKLPTLLVLLRPNSKILGLLAYKIISERAYNWLQHICSSSISKK